MSIFAQQLKEAMRINRYSQRFVAEKLHTTQQTVSNWANGIYEPSLEQLILLCEVLDVTPNFLLGYSDYE